MHSLRLVLFTLISAATSFTAPARNQFTIYLGGSLADSARTVAADPGGDVYVGGQISRVGGGEQAFVSRISADGSRVLWTARLDGPDVTAIAVDRDGAVWAGGAGSLLKLRAADGAVRDSVALTGITALAIDSTGALLAAHGASVTRVVDAVIDSATAFDAPVRALATGADGSVYAAYGTFVARLGSYVLDLGWTANAIAADAAGAAYVTGENAHIAKLSADGGRIALTIEPAGFLQQEGRGIAVDPFGNILVTGWTNSSDFARGRGWHGDRDGYLLKLTPAGETLETHFIGTAIRDELNAVALTPTGDVFVAGASEGPGMGSGPLAQLQGAADAIVVKFAADRTRALTSTTTTLTTTPATTATYGQPVTLTATVSPSGATGKVTFYDGTQVLGTANTSSGVAVLSTIALPAGNRSLHAFYRGDSNFDPSLSANVPFSVTTVPAAPFLSSRFGAVASGTGPASVVVADFNGDGKADIATANTTANNVTVSLGTGLLTFAEAPGSPFAVGTSPKFILSADFNGDGIADLAVANSGSGSISILLGNGSGGFTAGTPLSVTGTPTALTATDFNRDGFVDLAVNAGPGGLSVFFGAGNGTFPSVNTFSIPPALSIAHGDFNGDGNPDLVTTAESTRVLLGNGAGGFTITSPSIGFFLASLVAVADLNNDGNQDIVITGGGTAGFSSYEGMVTAYLGNGAGAFTAAPGTPFANTGTPWNAVALSDFNGDGFVDLALSAGYPGATANQVSLFYGAGNGSFTLAPGSPFAVGTLPSSLATGDFDGNGRVDLAVANSGASSVYIFPGLGVSSLVIGVSGGPNFTYSQPVTISATVTPPGASGVVTFLLDSTILGTAPVNASQAVFTTRLLPVGPHRLRAVYSGDATLGAATSNTISISVTAVASTALVAGPGSPVNVLSSPKGVIAADFNNDGKIDLAVANRTSNAISVLLGNGAGSFTPAPGSSIPVGASPLTLGTADFNRDGVPDLAVGHGSGGILFLGIGDGSFAMASTWASGTTPSEQIAITDFNGDALPDIARERIFLGTGLGTVNTVTANGGTTSVTSARLAGDFNNDTFVDVIDSNGQLILGKGTGQFMSPSATGFVPAISAVADFNGDGFPDVVTTTNTANTVSLFLSNGAGGFTASPSNPIPSSASPAAIAAIDFNGDGKLDLAVAGSNGLMILLGTGTGGFTAGPLHPVIGSGLATGDFNGDGRSDLAITVQADNMVTILLGSQNGPAQQPPTLVSNAPASVSGSPQAFSITARDPNGYSDIYRVYFLVNATPTIPQNSCHGFYDRALNAFFLFDDTLTGLLGPITPGVGNVVQNSQCQLVGGTSTVSATGTDLNLSFGLSLKTPFANQSRNVYFWVQDSAANGTGWIQTTSWVAAGQNQTPSIVSAVPTNASGQYQNLQITARDADGIADIARIYFLFNTTPTVPQNTCHGFYDRQSNAVYLFNDALTAATGGPNPINSQCSVQGAPISVFAPTASDLQVTIQFERRGAFANTTQNVYFLVTDQSGANSGWTKTGTWTPTPASQAPTAIPGGPTNPVGSPQVFTFTGRDPDGYTNLNRIYFLVDSSTNIGANTCHGFYNRSDNRIYLYNDGLTGFVGFLNPSTNSVLENSQCRINGATSSLVATAGTDLSIRIGMELKSPFSSTARKVYLLAVDNEQNSSGWVENSTWTHPAPSPSAPAVVSGTPTTLLGSPGILTFTARDPNGFRDIYRLYFLINSNTNIPANTCHGFYDRESNGIYLYNDSLTIPMGPIQPGSANTLSNSQCAINGATSALLEAGGTDLSLSLGVSLSGQYTILPQKVYLWVRDNEANDTGWVQTGVTTSPTINSPATVVSGVPAVATGSPQTFTFTIRRPAGPGSLTKGFFLIHNKATPEQNSCHGYVDLATQKLNLYNDALNSITAVDLGSNNTVQNSQCILYASTSAIVSNGATDLVFKVTVALTGVFSTSNQNVYLIGDASLGWVQTGKWYASGGSLAPVVTSGTPPAPVNGNPQQFTISARDWNGFADINRIYFLVNDDTGIPQNTCHGFYDRASNAIVLYNDALTALIGPLTPGANATIQNSQCTINGANSAVLSATGTDLTIRLGISRQGASATRKQQLYVWAVDNESNGTGWIENVIWLP